MFEYVEMAVAGCLVLAVGCALFGSDKLARRGYAVLRVLFGRRNDDAGDQ